MAFKTPQGITEAGITTGVSKANLKPGKMLVGSFLAGAYIAFAGIVAISVSSGLDPKTWGTLPTFFTGIAFVLARLLVVFAASGLSRGKMPPSPFPRLRPRSSVARLAKNSQSVRAG